jgi:microcompartment protein CcmK/EutM
MQLGRVIGRLWSTVKNPALTTQRLLVVQPVTPVLGGAPPTVVDSGRPLVCTDCTGAGSGELIYWVRGREASFPFLPEEVPADATVVGIVDELNFTPVAEPAPHSSKDAQRLPDSANKQKKKGA